MRPSIMSRAAHMPVSSEICAFHSSTGSVARLPSVHVPSACCSTTCSGVGSVMPPRALLRLLAQGADDLQQLQRLVGRAVVERLLRTVVRQLRSALYTLALDADVRRRTVLVEVDRPQQRRGTSARAAGSPGPSLSSGGCNGVRPSGAYSVSTRTRASSSIAPPGTTQAATSAIA